MIQYEKPMTVYHVQIRIEAEPPVGAHYIHPLYYKVGAPDVQTAIDTAVRYLPARITLRRNRGGADETIPVGRYTIGLCHILLDGVTHAYDPEDTTP